MALGFTNVYILQEGQQYTDVQKFCPNGDGFELTNLDATDPRKVWYIATCPIDAVRAATLTTVQNQVFPLFTALSTIGDHQRRVNMTNELSHTVISSWMLTNPAWPPEYADFVIDHGILRSMIYDELKRQGLVTELTSMDPPQ